VKEKEGLKPGSLKRSFPEPEKLEEGEGGQSLSRKHSGTQSRREEGGQA